MVVAEGLHVAVAEEPLNDAAELDSVAVGVAVAIGDVDGVGGVRDRLKGVVGLALGDDHVPDTDPVAVAERVPLRHADVVREPVGLAEGTRDVVRVCVGDAEGVCVAGDRVLVPLRVPEAPEGLRAALVVPLPDKEGLRVTESDADDGLLDRLGLCDGDLPVDVTLPYALSDAVADDAVRVRPDVEGERLCVTEDCVTLPVPEAVAVGEMERTDSDREIETEALGVMVREGDAGAVRVGRVTVAVADGDGEEVAERLALTLWVPDRLATRVRLALHDSVREWVREEKDADKDGDVEGAEAVCVGLALGLRVHVEADVEGEGVALGVWLPVEVRAKVTLREGVRERL